MAPEVIREQYYDETIDMWSLGITIIEMMDRVPPHYRIKDEYELFETVLSEPSPTFTYSYPTMYMRGLVAWLLDEDPRTRPSARDVIMVSEYLLQLSVPTSFVNIVFNRKLTPTFKATSCTLLRLTSSPVSCTRFCLDTCAVFNPPLRYYVLDLYEQAKIHQS
jgi:serine/threonine protein kinase